MATTNSLIIAPQWIGDAVMTEPLMRRLANRGERLTVGALPWVAPVYRAMPQVAEVIEFPFAHGGLDLVNRGLVITGLTHQFASRLRMKFVQPGAPGKIAVPRHRIVAARHYPPADMLGTHSQLRDFSRVGRIAANHVRHAFRVKQFLGLPLIMIRVFGIGGIE